MTNTGSPRVPHRTCIGCRQIEERAVLLRLVRDPESPSQVIADPHRRGSGRGAWVHRDPECVRRAVSRNAANRAFKAAVTVDQQMVLAVINAGAAGARTSTNDSKAG